MTSFKQKKARAQKALRPSRIETVALDYGLSEQRTELTAQVAAAGLDARAGYDPAAELQAKLDALELEEVDSLVRVKIYRTNSQTWARLCTENDYDLNRVSRAALLVDGRIIDGKNEAEQAPEEWSEFFDLIAPSEYATLINATMMLNERDALNRVERLKNFSAGTTGSN